MASDGEVARMDVPVNGEDVNDVLIVTGRAGVIRGRLVADDELGAAVQAGAGADIPAAARPLAAHDGHAAERGP